MTKPPSRDASDGERGDLLQELAEELLKYVVPLYRQPSGKRPVHAGTSFLLSYRGRDFLVTAGHVVANPQGLFFYIDVKTKRALTGRMMRSRPGPSGQPDSLDIAVVLLAEPGLPPYPGVQKQAGELEFFLAGSTDVCVDDVFLSTGMPASRTKANPHANELKIEAFSLIALRAPHETVKALGPMKLEQLVMTLDREDSMNTDGSPRVFPDPHGMSGSPVWRLATESKGINGAQLVGVLTEFHKDKSAIVATPIKHVVRLMDALLDEVSRTAASS